MEHIQIRTWSTNETIFEYEGTLKEAVEEAVRQGISLKYADLRDANLEGADLKGANLRDADLRDADLNNANLEGAHLSGADLNSAKLIGADLRFADLIDANLSNANLIGAGLNDAYFIRAYLRYAILKGANLEGAKFQNAILDNAIGIPDDLMPLACPSEGSFIAWKKVNGKLVKLEIPEDAKRSSATTNKCRCSKAKVLAITNLNETKTFVRVTNNKFVPLTYKIGKMVYPDSFDENRWNECSHGIHFFMDKEDAINW